MVCTPPQKKDGGRSVTSVDEQWEEGGGGQIKVSQVKV